MDTGLMKYQYEQIVKQLMLLQDHASARTCPYTPTGEMCIRKHLMTIEAYAVETLPMEENPDYQEKLASLESEAMNYRLDQEKVMCGANQEFLDGLDQWARKRRKDLEMHCLRCELEQQAQGQAKIGGDGNGKEKTEAVKT